MAKGAFDFTDVFQDIEKGIVNVLADKGNQETGQEIFANATKELVYPFYQPTQYERRMAGGGLSDPNNYEITSEGLITTILNNTESNYGQPKPSGGYINDIIEGGSGYEWEKSEIYQQQPYPRPFMDEATNRYAEYLLAMIDIMVFDGSGSGAAYA